MAYQSHIARTALRKALRTHPEAEAVLKGRLVSSLTLAELHNGLLALGLDPVNITIASGIEHDARLNSSEPASSAPDDDDLDIAESETETETETMTDNRAAETAAIEAEVQTIRGLIVTGGFGSLDDRLRQLVTEARKPPSKLGLRFRRRYPGRPGSYRETDRKERDLA
jgi:hypothetical protein